MNGLLVRVAADQSEGGGHWNGPVDSQTGKFVYAAIPETSRVRPGFDKPYGLLISAMVGFGLAVPPHLASQGMHLDPDFEHLTYGDQGERANQIRAKVRPGDLLVFYSGMRDVQPAEQLVYALIGLYVVQEIVPAVSVSESRWHENAHTRRKLAVGAADIVVRARPGKSGRLEHCVPIGDYRQRAYRVWPRLLKEWGGLTVNDGYLQRSARLPAFKDASKFYHWFLSQDVSLVRANN